jgi:hypothetical protein
MSYKRHITQLGAQLTLTTKPTKKLPIAIPTTRRQMLGTLYNSIITRFYKNL